METIYNIYCDESCHLENDQKEVMVLGAVWCPLETSHRIAEEIRKIKSSHGLARTFEIKWTKVSPAKAQFYLDLIDFFFNTKDLCFRALVVPDKSKLRHRDFQQTHDQWYYKMYFTLLKVIFAPHSRYRIYLDIKDTRSRDKRNKLHEVLCNSLHDFDKNIIEWIQPVHSHEVEQVQVADLLIGSVSYSNRKLTTSPAKNLLVDRVRKLSGRTLLQNTPRSEQKFNLFFWQAQQEDSNE
jgi:hypothetical protein